MDARKLAVPGFLVVAVLFAALSLFRTERKLAPRLAMAGAALEQPSTWMAGDAWSTVVFR